MKQPEISVCIVTCNQQKYIRQCVESAIAQAVDVTLEILVGDDCSDDNTGAIVAEIAALHPEIVRHIRHDSRLGACRNIQAVIAQAKGKFIAHLDGDDYWLPGKLKQQLIFITRDADCVAVYTNARTVNETGSPIGLFNNVGNQRFDLAALLRRGNFLNTSSMMIRSELKSQLLEIDGPFIDYRMHLRHARKGFVAQLGQSLVGYRVNSVGSMVSGANDLVRQLYWEAIMDVPRELVTDADFACGLADFLRRVFFRALRTRRWRLLRDWAPHVFRASPHGVGRTFFLTLWSILRTIWIEIVGRLQIGSGRPVKVLYRR